MQTVENGIAGARAERAIAVRAITLADVMIALRKGASDFWERPSHYLFLVIIYPVMGIVLAAWTTGGPLFPLLYPLVVGFALLGPLAAIGLYEISRRREVGLDDSPAHALQVLRSPARGAILRLGLLLAVLFVLWLMTANALYGAIFGASQPTSLSALIGVVFTTPQGWSLLLLGNLAGLGFALIALSTTVIAFPLLLDRGGSASQAVRTSLQAFSVNPLPLLGWGVIVTVLLALGSIPFFVGLALVLPILGHATWHLYRAMIP